MFWRWGVLYPLYALAECEQLILTRSIFYREKLTTICAAGIIFTDLAELLGSAFAINMCVKSLCRQPAVD